MNGILKGVAMGVGALLAGGVAYGIGANIGATRRLQKQYTADGVGDVGFAEAHRDAAKIFTTISEAMKAAEKTNK